MIPAAQERAKRLSGDGQIVLALDPGLDNPAIAVFEHGELLGASRVKLPTELKDLDRGERCRLVTWHIARAYWNYIGRDIAPSAVVAEWPQIYRASKSKGDPNGLVPLATLGVAVAASFGCELIAPTPAEWIGAVKKIEVSGETAWKSPRGQLIERRLNARSGSRPVTERSRVVPSHDAIDAIGLGMWVLGRLERVYVGST